LAALPGITHTHAHTHTNRHTHTHTQKANQLNVMGLIVYSVYS